MIDFADSGLGFSFAATIALGEAILSQKVLV